MPKKLIDPALATIEAIEVALLLEAIFQRWGHDFRDYAPNSMLRRIQRMMRLEQLSTISALQERVLRDPNCLRRFLDQVTVKVTAMFRDPAFYLSFRRIAVPILAEQKNLRIWHVGCASGEEVYSMAIVLHETGLLSRSRIYATDLNQEALDIAREGIYLQEKMQAESQSYQAAGGVAALSDYYRAAHGRVLMWSELSKNVVWAQHNLVTDASFNEFHLIMCRNVMIYFNRALQLRVHQLLYHSLTENGLLVLGCQESLQLTPKETCYRILDYRQKIFQRVV